MIPPIGSAGKPLALGWRSRTATSTSASPSR